MADTRAGMHSGQTLLLLAAAAIGCAGANAGEYSTTPTKADMIWLLPPQPPSPADNRPTRARVALGKMLFFDPRLSADGNLSCAGCHYPSFGWSDALPTAKGAKSKVLQRATPSLINSGYNTIHMWDGRIASLEAQAMAPMLSMEEMAMDLKVLVAWLERSPGYKTAFASAYPGEVIGQETVSKALAAFERTLVSNDSPFDRWLRGDATSMTPRQVRGFRVFSDPGKANCTACHHPPNFTDNGFHNIGLASYAQANPDMGRFAIKPVAAMRGAFKTPSLRDIALTAPYFRDGSAKTLMDVLDHYNRGGSSAKDRSPQIRPLNLTRADMEDVAAFLQALTTPAKPFVLPALPPN